MSAKLTIVVVVGLIVSVISLEEVDLLRVDQGESKGQIQQAFTTTVLLCGADRRAIDRLALGPGTLGDVAEVRVSHMIMVPILMFCQRNIYLRQGVEEHVHVGLIIDVVEILEDSKRIASNWSGCSGESNVVKLC